MNDVKYHMDSALQSLDNHVTSHLNMIQNEIYTTSAESQSQDKSIIQLILDLLLFNASSEMAQLFMLKNIHDNFTSTSMYCEEFKLMVHDKLGEIDAK